MRLNGVFNRAKCYFLKTSKRYNEYLDSKILSGRLGQQSLLLQPNQLLFLILKSLNYLLNLLEVNIAVVHLRARMKILRVRSVSIVLIWICKIE